VSEPEGKRPFGSPRPRRENNIKMDLKEIGWKRVDQIALAQEGSKCRARVAVKSSVSIKWWKFRD
jgi:hypothetical protein